MQSWEPNKLVQDDADIAYEPNDKEGKRTAAKITMLLNLMMWRAKMAQALSPPPRQHVNCRCITKPIDGL